MRKGFLNLTDSDQFRDTIFKIEGTTGTEVIATDLALGRVPSADIRSSINLPEFRRSTVDGYAVIGSDTHGASEGIPAYLDIVEDITVSATPTRALRPGQAAQIVTGGMVPDGADAAVMVEHTQLVDEKTLEVRKPVAHLENMTNIGDDIKKGDIIIPAGRPLRPFDIGALMGVGIMAIEVFKRPVVSIFSTGDEVVEPNETPPPGKVRDINKYAVAAGVAQAGGMPVLLPTVRDNLDALIDTIKNASRTSQMVILSGGSSVGGMDFTLEAINKSGRPGVLVHGLAVKPGKPTIYGIVNKVPVIGLPGHPAGALVIFMLFVAPLIRKIGGSSDIDPFGTTVEAVVERSIHGSPGRHVYIPVILEKGGLADPLLAVPILGPSGMISILTRSVGVIDIPPAREGIAAGQKVTVRLYKAS